MLLTRPFYQRVRERQQHEQYPIPDSSPETECQHTAKHQSPNPDLGFRVLGFRDLGAVLGTLNDDGVQHAAGSGHCHILGLQSARFEVYGTSQVRVVFKGM